MSAITNKFKNFIMKIFVIDTQESGLTDMVSLCFEGENASIFNHARTFADLGALVYREGIPDILVLDSSENEMILKNLKEFKYNRISVMLIVPCSRMSEKQIRGLIALGADAIIPKPFSVDILKMRMMELVKQNQKYFTLDYDTILLMCRMVEARDGITGHHVERVGRLAKRISDAIGIDKEEAEHIGLAAQIHDIGKTYIPDEILHKPGPLTPDEFAIMKQHTIKGAEIVATRKYNSIFHLAREIIVSHHERWDGAGYPYGLKRDEIPLSGRIVAIADVFDALTHKRDYKPAWPIDEAVNHIKDESKKMFDPNIVKNLFFGSINFRHIFEVR